MTPIRSGATAQRREVSLRIAFAHATGDASVATRIGSLLSESGATVVAADSSPPPDGLIVLLSDRGLDEPGWLPEAGGRTRPLPVRVGELDESKVPPYLRELNWIEWSPQRPAISLGFIVNSLLSDPSLYRLSRQLAHEAAVWDEAGRPRARLIGDRRYARRMAKLLTELERDPVAAPSPVTVEFVSASDRRTRRAQWRRRGIRAVALFVAISAISAAITAIPRVQTNARISQAAIVTAGNTAMLDEMPEWAAANAAVLLLEGTEAERLLGAKTLLAAMDRPWAMSDFGFIDSAVAAAPFAGGSRGIVLAQTRRGSGVALVDPQRGRTLWSAHLARRLESLDVARDGSFAALAGEGVGLIDLRTRRLETLTTKGTFVGVRILGRRVAAWTDGGRLELMRGDGETALVGNFESVLDILPDDKGGGTALVATSPDRYAIVDLDSGDVLARQRTRSSSGVGALSPDGRRAAVDGGGQVWTFGAEGPRPTGIPTSTLLNDLAWTSHERLVVAGESASPQVYFLPRGELLGPICAYGAAAAEVHLEPSGETAACSRGSRSFWRLPAAPRETAAPRPVDPPHLIRTSYAQVAIKGERGRISVTGLHGPTSTSWSNPFDSEITAAAFSPESYQLALGNRRGGVEILGLNREGVIFISGWEAPDRAPVVALRWSAARLVAETASGEIWDLPICRRCETSTGMIATVRARFSGCFSSRQLEWIDGQARDRLRLRECEPPLLIGEND